MAFNDFRHRMRVYDVPAMRRWIDANIKYGHWGYMFGLTGHTATYCFEFEEDLLAFKLVFGEHASS